MKVALSIPVDVEDAGFEFLMPDAMMARVLPAMLQVLVRMPDDDQAQIMAGTATEAMQAQLGFAMLDASLLQLAGEAFDAGVIAWEGIEAEDGSPLACSDKNKRYIPLLTKLFAVFSYVLKQQVLAGKKDVPTSAPMSASPPGSPEAM